MSKLKQLAEEVAKEEEAPAVDERASAPDKQAGPGRPRSRPPEAVERGAGPAQRARRMAALQRKVGNVRMGRMLDAVCQPESASVAPIEAEAESKGKAS